MRVQSLASSLWKGFLKRSSLNFRLLCKVIIFGGVQSRVASLHKCWPHPVDLAETQLHNFRINLTSSGRISHAHHLMQLPTRCSGRKLTDTQSFVKKLQLENSGISNRRQHIHTLNMTHTCLKQNTLDVMLEETTCKWCQGRLESGKPRSLENEQVFSRQVRSAQQPNPARSGRTGERYLRRTAGCCWCCWWCSATPWSSPTPTGRSRRGWWWSPWPGTRRAADPAAGAWPPGGSASPSTSSRGPRHRSYQPWSWRNPAGGSRPFPCASSYPRLIQNFGGRTAAAAGEEKLSRNFAGSFRASSSTEFLLVSPQKTQQSLVGAPKSEPPQKKTHKLMCNKKVWTKMADVGGSVDLIYRKRCLVNGKRCIDAPQKQWGQICVKLCVDIRIIQSLDYCGSERHVSTRTLSLSHTPLRSPWTYLLTNMITFKYYLW